MATFQLRPNRLPGLNFWTRSITSKFLLAFLAMAVIPLLLVGGLAYWQSDRALREQVNEDARIRTHLNGDFVQHWIDERMDDMAVIAGLARVQTMDPAQAGDGIKQYYDQWGIYESMFVAGPDGKTLYTTDGKQFNLDDRVYFQRAIKGEMNVSDPVVSKATGNIVLPVAAPVISNGQIVGVVGGMIPTTLFQSILETTRRGQTGEAYLINQNRYFITPARFTEQLKQAGLIKERAELELQADTLAARQVVAGQEGMAEYLDYRGQQVLGAYYPLKNVSWGLIVEQDSAEAFADIIAMRTTVMVGVGVTAVVVAFLAFLIARGIANPVRRMTEVARSLAQGDIEQEVSYYGQDEVGELAGSLRQVITYQRAMAAMANRIADGDLAVTVSPQSARDGLGQAFSRMVTSLVNSVTKVAQNAGQLRTASEQLALAAQQAGQATSQIALTIQHIASGASQQAVSVAETTGMVGQMRLVINGVAQASEEQAQAVAQVVTITTNIKEAIRQVTGNAQVVTHDSAKTTEVARSGKHTVEETVKGMELIKARVEVSTARVQEMRQRSSQIGGILETIEDIADQTNLLALNAAIEAARAGEHGKGFAVVAHEVRKLAERASAATKEIGGLIYGVEQSAAEAVAAMAAGADEVEAGVKRANQASEALVNILQAAEAVRQQAEAALQAAQHMNQAAAELMTATDNVGQVAQQNIASTEEMTTGADEVMGAMENVASISQENSAAVEEVSASTEEMSAQVEEVSRSAQSLYEMAQTLQAVVARFTLTGPAGAAQPGRPATAVANGKPLPAQPAPKPGLQMKWDESMTTGNPEIDEQHRQLIDALNTLIQAMQQGKGRQEINHTFDFLASYVQTHFSFEEACMEKHRCPVAGKNKVLHAKFIAAMNSMLEQFEREGPSAALAIRVKDELLDWFVAHIRGVDTQLKKCARPQDQWASDLTPEKAIR